MAAFDIHARTVVSAGVSKIIGLRRGEVIINNTETLNDINNTKPLTGREKAITRAGINFSKETEEKGQLLSFNNRFGKSDKI